jgi:predicted esterase
MMHGTADPLIPLERSRRLAARLKAAGVEVTLDVVEAVDMEVHSSGLRRDRNVRLTSPIAILCRDESAR